MMYLEIHSPLSVPIGTERGAPHLHVYTNNEVLWVQRRSLTDHTDAKMIRRIQHAAVRTNIRIRQHTQWSTSKYAINTYCGNR